MISLIFLAKQLLFINIVIIII